jgi:hypothetical protein
MLRKYPLTTLFIIATVCVDVALVGTARQFRDEIDLSDGFRFYIFSFGIPSQLSVLALWAAFGKLRPLTMAAWVTFACGAILLMHWVLLAPALLDEHITLHLLQVFIVVIGAIFFRIVGVGKPDTNAEQPFQFSLVEMFGWTMIVALWAFAFRASSGRILLDRYFIIWLVASTIAPLMVAPVLYGKFSTAMRLVGLVSVYLLVLLSYVIVLYYFDKPVPANDWVFPIFHWAFGLVFTQISYISAWWAVIRMDEAMQERQAITEASREKLKLFEPSSTK